MKKTLLLTIVVLSCILSMNAQSSRFHISGVFPVGDFGDDDFNNDKSSHAAFGFGIGYKKYQPLSVENLSWLIGIDAYYNGLQADMKDRIEDYYSNADVTFNKFINVPVTVGLNYTFPASDQIGIYGEFGIGANLSWVTPDKRKYKSTKYEVSSTYKPAFGFAYGIEGGFVFLQKFTLGLRYNYLGSYRYKETETVNNDGHKTKTKSKTDRTPISNVSLVLGVKF